MQGVLDLWCSHPIFDEATRAQAQSIRAGNPEACAACFGSELAFGTGGLRGVLGVGTNRLNVYTVARASQGLALFLRAKKDTPRVAIAYDSRLCSPEFAQAAAETFAANGVQAYLWDRLMPTPVLSFTVRALACDAGIVITASHNPQQYNGYKVYQADGCQITDTDAAAVTTYIDQVAYTDLKRMDIAQARVEGQILTVPESVYADYLHATLAHADGTDMGKLRAIYTPLNGAGLEPVVDVLQHIGLANLHVLESQRLPDGRFPTCPSPNPELDATLAPAIAQAETLGADLVLATDPDCDRVGVAVRTKAGFHRLTGNEVGLLLLSDLLSHTKAAHPVVIKTIVTSDLAYPIAKAHGAEVIDVLTGFKYIGETMGRLEAEGRANDFVLGFEESCGYLTGTHVRDKDGVMAVLLVVQMAARLKAQGLTLWDRMEELYRTHGYLATRLVSVDIEDAQPMARMRAILQRLRETPPTSLGGQPITEACDYLPGIRGLPPSDVLSFAVGSDCKVIVRPSGTEPRVKLYVFARAASECAAEKAAEALCAQGKAWLQG